MTRSCDKQKNKTQEDYLKLIRSSSESKQAKNYHGFTEL